MASTKIQILYEPRSDDAALSGGSWRAALPLAHLQDRELYRVARSTNLTLASTQFRVSLPAVRGFRTLVVGPMSVTSAFKFRIGAWENSDFTRNLADTSWLAPFSSSSDPLDLEWEDPNFWLGVVGADRDDDPERGIYLIHDFGEYVSARYWSFELDDQTNPAGYIDIGRLFMPTMLEPEVNYTPGNNGLSFVNNALVRRRLNGGKQIRRRINPRIFRAGFDYLQEGPSFSAFYRLMRVAAYDGEVFVIPDPADTPNLQKRSFLGTFNVLDALSQVAYGLIGTGFEIEESI